MKRIIKYKCDFCKRSYVSKHKAKEHENKCFCNPAVRSCATCDHRDTKVTCDDAGLIDDIISWCFKMDKEIFRKGAPVRDCICWWQWEGEVEEGC
jgi:hypothetical protein